MSLWMLEGSHSELQVSLSLIFNLQHRGYRTCTSLLSSLQTGPGLDAAVSKNTNGTDIDYTEHLSVY